MSKDRWRKYFLRHARAYASTPSRLLTFICFQILGGVSVVLIVLVAGRNASVMPGIFFVGYVVFFYCIFQPVLFLFALRACQQYLPDVSSSKRIEEK